MQTREVQGKLWSTAPGDWARNLEPTFIPMYQGVLESLDIDEDTVLLDAGCGSGLFLSMASAEGARVYGIDAASGLLEITRKRVPGASLLIEDLESLPFSDESFDIVTGFNSFQYAGSFNAALAEAKRVTKKDGHLVIGIWGKESLCEAGTVLREVASLLPPPPPGTPGPFALSEEGKLETILNGIGLRLVKKETVSCPWMFYGSQALLQGFLCTGPCVKAALAAGEEKVREAIMSSAAPFKLTDDVYFMRNQFQYFIAERID